MSVLFDASGKPCFSFFGGESSKEKADHIRGEEPVGAVAPAEGDEMDGYERSRAESRFLEDVPSGRSDIPVLPESVLQAVTDQLVARLVHERPAGQTGTEVPDGPTLCELDAFCDALIMADAARSRQFFDTLRRQGKSPDTLCLRYIAPAARRLGERWISDECTFLEVTLGTSRLHGLQRSLRGDFSPAGLYKAPEFRALFTVAPGDTHALGVTIAADFFRRAGWTVDLHTSPEAETLLAQASLCEYPLIGISVAHETSGGCLKDVIRRLRNLQPTATLVLGGGVSRNESALVEKFGVDALIEDVTTAPFWLKTVVKSAQSH